MTRAGNESISSEPRSAARACQFCRKRKIRCDALKPTCTTCRSSNRTCSYHHGPAKPRPSTALLNAAREEKNELERMLIRLKLATSTERDALLTYVDVVDGKVHIREGSREVEVKAAAAATGAAAIHNGRATATSPSAVPLVMDVGNEPSGNGYPTPSRSGTRETAGAEDDLSSSDDEDDNNTEVGDVSLSFLPLEKNSRMGPLALASVSSRRPSSAATARFNSSVPAPLPSIANTLRYQLIANAAMSRQQEYRLRSLSTIRGVSAELALHLLDLHWNRQHHTYLLTYRPVFMRELVDGGSYCTDFLLYSVFACASKFSERIELRTDPADPETVGQDFFQRCEEIIARDAVLSQSRIPTIVGLLMLGATYNARGHASKGWLYTGYALRMVFDLGLHLDTHDHNNAAIDPEELEIRRRVFWGAFICEKLQSVYLGRPVTIQLRDAHVSQDFMDTFEELEPWAPYIDPKSHTDANTLAASGGQWNNAVIYSVSVFQQLCSLAKIMTNIINKVYFEDKTARKTYKVLGQIDKSLVQWYRDLPPHLVYEPWTRSLDPSAAATTTATATATPNLTILHTTYHCLVILLHCPFISSGITNMQETLTTTTPNGSKGESGTQRTVAANAWKRCTTAARNITNLALAYRATYPLRKSNYMLSYAVYVACTIHVHNAAAVFGNNGSSHNTGGGVNSGNAPFESDSTQLLRASLVCLDELAVPNSGVADTARIIRKLMAAKGIPEFLGLAGGEGAGGGPTVESQFLSNHDTAYNAGFDGENFSWPLFSESPAFDQLAQLQSFSDFGLSGHDLLFGFMEGNFSPSEFMDCPSL